MATLKLEIVTPEAKSYSDTVDMVVIPGVEGELGVLPDHAPLMTQLIPGELKVTKDGHELLMAVGEGFVEVTPDKVAVLTDMAVRENDIDESAVEAAISRAQESLKNEALSKEESAALTASLQKSVVQLNLKRRRRS
jgi:F-type H+-transporting ATPase subunit epsilon